MSHSPVLSDLQAPYVAADRLTRSRRHPVELRGNTRHRLAARLRRTADRLDG